MHIKSEKNYWKLIPIIIFTVFLIIYIIFELTGILTLSQVKEILQQSQPYTALIIIGLLIIDLILPIPSSVVMTFSGSIYEFMGGAILGTIGSITGSTIGFIIFRKKGFKIIKKFINQNEQKSMNKWFNLSFPLIDPSQEQPCRCFPDLVFLHVDQKNTNHLDQKQGHKDLLLLFPCILQNGHMI